MFELTSVRLPTIYVTARDRNRLQALLASAHRFIPDSVRADLRRELARAVVCVDGEIPPDVVTMNSRALFRADPGAELQSRTLIFDDDHSSLGGTISIATATGAALLGLRAGSRMPYANSDGERRVLVLERVAYQPEARDRPGNEPYRRWPAAPAGKSEVIAFPLRSSQAGSPEPSDDPGPNAA
jgi:regulator of nucleoside diphosphate kinase